MKAPLLKRRLNPFLLASIVLILALLAGLSVIYQGKLSDLVTDKRNLTEELQDRKERITTLEQDKSNLSAQLSTTKDDLDKYITLYGQEKKKRKSLGDEVDNLESETDELEESIEDLGETVSDVNETLGFVCQNSDNNLTDTTEESFCEPAGWEVE